MKNIVNIINFVRGIEPRPVAKHINLKEPVREQIRLLRKYGLRGTFLLQYDALTDPEFVEIIGECRDFCEIGLWLEVVEPEVRACGLVWRGRYPWDWHNDVGFLIGYEPSDRPRLIDEAMEKFREVFGEYPRSVGSWHIDALSLSYLYDKYRIKASCNCRDQIGTDGYTMQGGYYNHAYYPSRKNMLCPAASEEQKIPVPVFRMLGSDPIYVYDYQGVDYGMREISSLEPVCHENYPEYPAWYFDEIFDGTGISFQYTQVGQENSFGWPRMRIGLEYQIKRLKEMSDGGRVEIMTLSEAGEWFSSTFSVTPPTTYSAMSDWRGEGRRSLWYSCGRYRACVMLDRGALRIRDLYLFDENYEEKYLFERCRSSFCEYRNLPVMDGALYSNKATGLVAGLYFSDNDGKILWDGVGYSESDGCATLRAVSKKGSVCISFSEEGIEIRTDVPDLFLLPLCDASVFSGGEVSADEKLVDYNSDDAKISMPSGIFADGDTVKISFNGREYGVKIACGTLGDGFCVYPDDGVIGLSFELY